jgi:hypothetical protein
MDEREIESLDEAIDELLSLGYLQHVEPEGCSVEVTEAESPYGTGSLRGELD